MSSSAFTPSTTTVTNNVPVNVPVVTAWQSLLATVTGNSQVTGKFSFGASTTAPTFGTSAFNEAQFRQVGDSLQFTLSLGLSTAGTTGTGIYRLYIPAEYTIDQTKLPNSGGQAVRGICGHGFISDNGGNNNHVYIGATTSTYLTFQIQNAASDWASTSLPNFNSTTFRTSLTFTIPVTQKSGTTTLADRAVEEYAWSTSTLTTAGGTQTDDGLYGYGIAGAQFNAVASTTVNSRTRLRVRFQTAIQQTDSLSLEVFNSAVATWSSVGNSSLDFCPLTFQNTSAYGMTIETISGSTTDVYVSFGNCGRLANAATYANNNGSTWSGVAGSASYKWRVRKVSSGSQVGYPVSARNIVGDTSGTVVPTGMIGQTVAASSDAPTSVAGSNTDKTVTTITLPAGNWLIFGQVYFDAAGTTTTRLQTSISTGTSSLTGTILGVLGLDFVEGYATLSGGYVNANYNFPANVTATTTYNINVRVTYTGTPSASPLRTVIRAIRIA